MDKKLIVANWKMAPQTLAEAEGILEFVDQYLGSIEFSPPTPRSGSRLSNVGIIFCPPFIFTEEVAKFLNMSHLEHQSFLGAQDISSEDKTALTGEVSGPMLRKIGVEYVIIGHSERRWKLGESNEAVNQKLKAALRNEMIPIVCIGEKTRDGDFDKFLEEQVKGTFQDLSADEIGKCIVAYEPVWAISSNPGSHPDTATSALESIKIIQEVLIGNWKLEIGSLPKVLYGGSVNSKNAADFLKEKEINGILVGGASVNKEEFVKILEISAKIN